jgi:hypothetical protein
MAKLTRNLKLIIEDNSTDSAKKNLEKIDASMGAQTTDEAGNVQLRSKADIAILPANTDVGGSAGAGGNVVFAEASKEADSVTFFSKLVTLGRKLALFGKTPHSTKKLNIEFEDANSSASRTLTLDPKDGDRTVTLGGNLETDQDIVLHGPADVQLPPTGTLVSKDSADILVNKTIDADSNTLSNLTEYNFSPATKIPANLLNLEGAIKNGDISSTAAIAYSKLQLDGSITNADINSNAAISRSKIALTGTLVAADLAPGTKIPAANLELTGQLTNSDISTGAAIARSKLAPGLANQVVTNSGDGTLTSLPALPVGLGGTGVAGTATYPTAGTVQTESNAGILTNKTIDGNSNTISNIQKSSLLLSNSITDADIAATAAIDHSKLNLVNSISNAQVAVGAAIQGTKTDASFGAQSVKTGVGIDLQIGGYRTRLKPAQVGQNANVDLELPNTQGTSGQVLTTDGFGKLGWLSTGTGSVTSVNVDTPVDLLTVSGGPITTNGTFTLEKAPVAATRVYAGPVDGADQDPQFRSLEATDLPTHQHQISNVIGLQTALDIKASNVDLAAGLAGKENTISTANSSFFLAGTKTFRQVTAADLSGLAAVATSGSKADVGLANVNNTSDVNKPVSVLQAAADAAVQAFSIQRANHTGTQSVSTITGLATIATSGNKSDIGLGNVDNTSDLSKPVSTQQQAALDLKANKSGDVFTGDVTVQDARLLIDSFSDGNIFAFDPNMAEMVVKNDTIAPGITTILQPGQVVVNEINQISFNTTGNTSIGPGTVSLYAFNNMPALPSLDEHATTKVYVDTGLAGKANTSHTHSIANVTGLQTALNAKEVTSNKGVADGYASLDGSGKVPSAQLPDSVLGALQYQGVIPASGTLPTLTKGQYYIISVQGTFTGTSIVLHVGDWIVGNGTSSGNLAPGVDTVDNTDSVSSVNGQTGAVVLAKADIGLANVDNTSDASKPISTATQTALDGKAAVSHSHSISQITGLQTALDTKAATSYVDTQVGLKVSTSLLGVANGVATLNSSGIIPSSQLPAVAYPVTSVNTRTGDVVLTKTDLGLSNVDNTSDINKPVSTLQAAANAQVQAFSIQRANHTGTQAASTITGLAVVATSGNKADIGLGNVDNTSDANKPVSVAQAAADAAVQAFAIQRANHTGTQAASTITGLAAVATSGSKADVGLANVDNTSDLNKPISTATQTALNTKASTVHTHVISDVINLQSSLDSKAGTGLTNLTTTGLAVGALLVGSSSSAVVGLSPGSNNQVLTLVGGTPTWSNTQATTASFKSTQNIDVGQDNSFDINHGLGSTDVIVQLYDNSTGLTLNADVLRIDLNNVRISTKQTFPTSTLVSTRLLVLKL